MSYILDALRRADAERQSGKVPGLHTRQVTTAASQNAPGARRRLWLAVAAALALLAIAAGLWFWRAPADEKRLPAAEVALVQPAPTLTPAPAPAAPAVEPKPQPAVPPVRAVVPPPSAARPAAPVAKPAAKASASPAAPADIPLLSQLSEDLRRQISPLLINGVVYAKNPALRMLVVNQQVLTQGSQAAPEVTLEEIQPRSSVFSFRGTRFRVAH